MFTTSSDFQCTIYFYFIIQYITLLFQNSTPFSELEQQLNSYNDLIQIPLQPLMDNLSSATYDVFERDSVKYQLVLIQCFVSFELV